MVPLTRPSRPPHRGNLDAGAAIAHAIGLLTAMIAAAQQARYDQLNSTSA